jgi:hypothetical protein
MKEMTCRAHLQVTARGVDRDGWRGEWAAGEDGEVGRFEGSRPRVPVFFFLFSSFPFLSYFQVPFEFRIRIQTCIKFILNLYCDFKSINFGNI